YAAWGGGWVDEYHVGGGYRAHQGDRVGEGDRWAAAEYPASVPAGECVDQPDRGGFWDCAGGVGGESILDVFVDGICGALGLGACGGLALEWGGVVGGVVSGEEGGAVESDRGVEV